MSVTTLARLHRIDKDLADIGAQFKAAGACGDIDLARVLLERIDELLGERSRVSHGGSRITEADCG